MIKERHLYEAESMVQFILDGHNLRETAEEHGVTIEVVNDRIRKKGYTYADLVEIREKSKSKKS